MLYPPPLLSERSDTDSIRVSGANKIKRPVAGGQVAAGVLQATVVGASKNT